MRNLRCPQQSSNKQSSRHWQPGTAQIWPTAAGWPMRAATTLRNQTNAACCALACQWCVLTAPLAAAPLLPFSIQGQPGIKKQSQGVESAMSPRPSATSTSVEARVICPAGKRPVACQCHSTGLPGCAYARVRARRWACGHVEARAPNRAGVLARMPWLEQINQFSARLSILQPTPYQLLEHQVTHRFIQ